MNCCKEEVEEIVGVVWRTHALKKGIYGGRCSITEEAINGGVQPLMEKGSNYNISNYLKKYIFFFEEIT